MRYWLNCNECSEKIKSKFFLAKCGHIFFSDCLAKDDAHELKGYLCHVCKKRCAYVPPVKDQQQANVQYSTKHNSSQIAILEADLRKKDAEIRNKEAKINELLKEYELLEKRLAQLAQQSGSNSGQHSNNSTNIQSVVGTLRPEHSLEGIMDSTL